MDTQKQQVIDRLKQATNILVTVSNNPSVDQLSAAIGITLLLNRLGKHATAVYSGKTPSTIEFLQPDKTLEKNTDSLRDFIIALDKSKADKLRYKVEDQMVKIFITPYRTSISDKDLEFSQGDFNVEVVLALGVARQKDLDQAITAHGRILHDATVIGVATHTEEEALGSINWVDGQASSLSEMMTELGLALDEKVLDGQMANALLTGVVAETERFSNQKTTAVTMQTSAKLMAAGANQQLVASELATPEMLGAKLSEQTGEVAAEGEKGQGEPASADGSLVIDHDPITSPGLAPLEDMELPEPEEPSEVDQIHIDYDGQLLPGSDERSQSTGSMESSLTGGSRLIMQPPTLGGKLTANSEPESLDPSIDPLTPVTPRPLLHRDTRPVAPTDARLVPEPVTPEPVRAQPEPMIPLAPEPAPQPVVPESPPTPPTPPESPPTPPTPSPPPAPTPPVPPLASPVVSPQPNVPKIEPKHDTLADLEKFVSSPHISKPVEPPVVPVAPPTPVPATEPGLQKLDVPSPQEAAVASPEPPKPPLLEPLPSEAEVASDDDVVTDLNAARDAVKQAVSSATTPVLEPVKSLNAMPIDLDLGDIPAVNTSPASAFTNPSDYVPPVIPGAEVSEEPPAILDTHVTSDPDLPPGLITNEPTDKTAGNVTDPTAPPPVPPPMMPPSFGGGQPIDNEAPIIPPVL